MNILADNKKAFFDYEILDKFEAGIVLFGFEVKSVKMKRMSLKGSFITVRNGEAYLAGANIPPFQPRNTPQNYDPARPRKLLLHKKEINYLIGKSKVRGLTIVPLKMYNNKGKIKLEFGVARGKKKYEKKEKIKKRDIEREIRKFGGES